MKQRTFTGAVVLAVLVLVLCLRSILSTYIFDAFILLLSAYSAYEMCNLLAKMNCYNEKYFAIAFPFVAYIIYLIGIFREIKWYVLLLIELSIILLFVGVIGVITFSFPKRTKNEILTRNLKIKYENFAIYKSIHTMFAFFYPSVLMLPFIFINNLANTSYLFDVPVEILTLFATFIIILTFVIPIFVDTFAYLTGILFKGPKLCEKISPNKTISGAVGGIIWGTISSVLVFLIFNAIPSFNDVFVHLGLAFWQFIILGVVVSLFCELGDIFESYLKRKANVKDSGKLLPGHGGILDRIDSHLFAAPIMFIFLLIVLL